jgi:hypothetical protein
MGINQVSVLSLEMFRDIDGCLRQYKKPMTILNGLTGINLSKASNNGFAIGAFIFTKLNFL